jgi:hypothetical protein
LKAKMGLGPMPEARALPVGSNRVAVEEEATESVGAPAGSQQKR